MDNPEHIQSMTTNQSREESDQNPPAVEADPENTERITVSRKRFIATVVLLVAIIVGLLVALLVGMWFSSKGEAQKVETCWTRECLGMASMLQNYRNPSVDPCDDFYEHTCGLLYEHSDDDVANTYKQYRRLLHQVQYLVTNTPKFDSKASQQMKMFSEKCEDRKGMNSDTMEDLRKDIEKRGGFPLIDPNWDESKFDLSDMLAQHIKINRKRMGFLSVEPYTTIENNKSINHLYVSPGPHFVYSYVMGLEGYKKGVAELIRRMLKLENRELKDDAFDEEFQKLVDLEKRLMKLADYASIEYDTDNINKMRTIEEVSAQIPELNWSKIIKAMVRDDAKNKEELEKLLLKNVHIHGGGEFFFGEKRELSSIINSTPKTVLANYVVARQLVDIAFFFSDQDMSSHAKFYNHANQKSFCASQLAQFFPTPSMNVYIQKSGYNMDNLKLAPEIFGRVKEEYRKMITESPYLEPKIREALLKKLTKLTGTFAHQDYIEPSKLSEQLYEHLNFDKNDTPYHTYMKLWRHRTENLVDHVIYDTPLDPVNLKMFALYAAYQSYSNGFYVNIAYLMYPWLDAGLPLSHNYGDLGYVIAHEIGHAFDFFHRKLDENGKLYNIWITETNSSNTEYGRREQCLRDQYSEYKEPGYDFFMNGTQSRLEIIADHLGALTAYRAFQQVKDLDKIRLPGTHGASQEQMFFYSFALRQCDIQKASEYIMKRRVHPTSRFRVNGVVQNMPEFFEAFKCPKTAKLNINNKCEALY